MVLILLWFYSTHHAETCDNPQNEQAAGWVAGCGPQPTSSPDHGGWHQPTLKADLSTWANGLVTGRYCWQTELCVPCSTSEDTALAALQRQFLLAAPSTCSKQPRMFVGSLGGDIIGLWWVAVCCPFCMAQLLLAFCVYRCSAEESAQLSSKPRGGQQPDRHLLRRESSSAPSSSRKQWCLLPSPIAVVSGSVQYGTYTTTPQHHTRAASTRKHILTISHPAAAGVLASGANIRTRHADR